jgi:hypothetical protein
VDAVDPSDAMARVQLGVTYHQGGHLKAASSHYVLALQRLAPPGVVEGEDGEARVSVLVSLAEAQRDLGFTQAACSSLAQVKS